MGLAHRIIPTLLIRGGSLIKGKQFNSWRSVGVPEQAMHIHTVRGVDELCVIDIGATPSGDGPDFKMIERLTDCCFSPITYGGGIRTKDDVQMVLKSGADRALIGTGGPRLIAECASRFGSQAIVAALDVKDGYAVVRCGSMITKNTAVCWAKSCEMHGAGEILLTSIEREGTTTGYDLELIRTISHAVDIPVIAHGGCSGYEDMAAAVKAGASAVAAGALFLWTDATPRGAAEYLNAQGIEARV